jgi:hypothetical protein
MAKPNPSSNAVVTAAETWAAAVKVNTGVVGRPA